MPPRRVDLPLLAIGVVLASVFVFNVGIQLAKDRCLDAGGRIRYAGLDRSCELAGGGTMPMTLTPTTTIGWTAAALLWAATASGLTWGMARFIGGVSGEQS